MMPATALVVHVDDEGLVVAHEWHAHRRATWT